MAGTSRRLAHAHCAQTRLPAFSIGESILLNVEDEILVYKRGQATERLIVVLNLGERPHRLQLPNWRRGSRLLLSTVEGAALVEDGALQLRSNEAVVLEADSTQ